jgi:CRISPR-associated protein Cas2
MNMLIIVTYDIATETPAGRRRLRRIARICESMGQRVQKSVFECKIDQMQYEDLERRLLVEMDEKEDNLRLYRLHEPNNLHIKEYGCFRAIDFERTLIV